MHAPTAELLSLFQSAHLPSASAVHTWEAAQERAAHLLSTAKTRLQEAQSAANDIQAKICVTDEVAALCTGAVAAAHGLLLGASLDVFKQGPALAALSAELELSTGTSEPLQAVRERAAGTVGITGADAFLAHQGMVLSGGIIEWTAERVSQVLAH